MATTGPVADPDADFCYLTTTGRRSGAPHRIEIWFAVADDGTTLYLLAGGRDSSDWVRNLRADARCTVGIATRDAPAHPGEARVLDVDDDESAAARQLVFDKYQPRGHGDLAGWRDRSLPVAIDLGRADVAPAD
ncbi:nitroreductase family deazaflavin-dependent oxidoreductase [Dermatobacter hominis]|uniref:nitroreductase family deazaflavin-dependent oxidoreductase n=1 Tax=Dermatobacter hominis TaxID=2884263 RepID=UPI001D10726E|nr:nitroreductase family deazaflavin-dependent oxidoreductase [Dermatobacter hominis]UDY36616.1 nitroreductase family deazaflavin-dependent oxidoreductase [Dermatobacter hominis]